MSEPRYITDAAGNRIAAVLDIEEYERLQKAAEWFASLHPAIQAALTASTDDEPYTDEERQAVEQARASVRAGHVHTHDDIKQRFLG